MDKLTERRINELRELKARCELGGGEVKIEKQHNKGKMTARERLDYILDEGSFVEFGKLIGHLDNLPADGNICGHGKINGRTVCIFSQDATVKGGSIGMMHGLKMYLVIERALNMGVPYIGLNDSPGARLPQLQEGRSAMGEGFGDKNAGSVFYPNTQASGVIPQISAILGSSAGISVYSPAMTDFIFMVDKKSHMFITGPVMVKTVTGEDLTMEQLGGAEIHCKVSGVADGRFPDEYSLLDGIRDLLSYLPFNNTELPPVFDGGDDPDRMVDELADIVPAAPAQAFDMHEVIYSVLDGGRFFEIKPEFAGEIIVGFGRINNNVVGIVANQPLVYAGSMTVDSSDKQARFIRYCDAFNIPIVLFVDTPAYMPGSDQEHRGIIRHGAKVLYALCEATVPKVAVVLRKSYGGGNLGMGVVPGMGTDHIYFWPIVEVGVMGAPASVNLYFGKEIMEAENPAEYTKNKIQEFSEKYANPLREAAFHWGLEDVIEPRETRKCIIQSLEFLKKKNRPNKPKHEKRHGNIPL